VGGVSISGKLQNNRVVVLNKKTKRWTFSGPPGTQQVRITGIHIEKSLRRQGWATYIMRCLIDSWGSMGTETFIADPRKSVAKHFYKSMGFAPNPSQQLVLTLEPSADPGPWGVPATATELRIILAQVRPNPRTPHPSRHTILFFSHTHHTHTLS
jgi:hypothetical protein